ncbi:unnamed protein product, partial [Cylicostephanus goldi]
FVFFQRIFNGNVCDYECTSVLRGIPEESLPELNDNVAPAHRLHAVHNNSPPCNACQFASNNANPLAKLHNVLNLVLQAATNNVVLASKLSSSHNSNHAINANNPAVARAPPQCAKVPAKPAVPHHAEVKHHLR